MQKYKEEFIEFLVKTGALKFGEFTLKSGRKSPYFINTGMFNDGSSISKLGYFYASKINEELNGRFDIIFGPAYKGIPLALTTAISLSKDFKVNIGYCFDRKEEKDHGDKGAIVGCQISDGKKIVIIDDVITSGSSIDYSFELLKKQANAQIPLVVVSVDRQEVGKEGNNALKEIEVKHKTAVRAIVTVSEIKEYLHNRAINDVVYINDEMKAKMDEYAKQYGV